VRKAVITISIPIDTLYILIRNAAYEQECEIIRFFCGTAGERPLIPIAAFSQPLPSQPDKNPSVIGVNKSSASSPFGGAGNRNGGA
jgi:hypothetical protein